MSTEFGVEIYIKTAECTKEKKIYLVKCINLWTKKIKKQFVAHVFASKNKQSLFRKICLLGTPNRRISTCSSWGWELVKASLENEEMQISHCLVRKKITKTPTAGCFGPPRNSILLILWTRYKPRALEQQKHTLPEAPENGWLEYSFPFRMAYFQVRTDSFEGRLDQNFQLTWSKLLVSRSLKAPETNYTHLNQLQLPPSFLDRQSTTF